MNELYKERDLILEKHKETFGAYKAAKKELDVILKKIKQERQKNLKEKEELKKTKNKVSWFDFCSKILSLNFEEVIDFEKTNCLEARNFLNGTLLSVRGYFPEDNQNSFRINIPKKAKRRDILLLIDIIKKIEPFSIKKTFSILEKGLSENYSYRLEKKEEELFPWQIITYRHGSKGKLYSFSKVEDAIFYISIHLTSN